MTSRLNAEAFPHEPGQPSWLSFWELTSSLFQPIKVVHNYNKWPTTSPPLADKTTCMKSQTHTESYYILRQTITLHRCHISENRHRPSEVSYYMTTNFKNFFCSKIWTVSPTISGPVFRSTSSLKEKLIALLTITNYQGSHLGMQGYMHFCFRWMADVEHPSCWRILLKALFLSSDRLRFCISRHKVQIFPRHNWKGRWPLLTSFCIGDPRIDLADPVHGMRRYFSFE